MTGYRAIDDRFGVQLVANGASPSEPIEAFERTPTTTPTPGADTTSGAERDPDALDLAGVVVRSGHGRLVARVHPTDTSEDSGPPRTSLVTARASSPLRFVRPTFPGSTACAVCLVTLGGGLVDGDVIHLEVEVEPNATLVIFTQATTKAFRGQSRQSLRATVRGTLILLPDPVACFRGSRYEQTVDVDLFGAGSCVLLDGFTSGRPAYGERWAFERLATTTTIRRDGRRISRDATRLDTRDGSIPERMDSFETFVSLTAVGPRVAAITESIREPLGTSRASLAHRRRASNDDSHVVAASSVLPRAVDGAMVRIAGTSPTSAMKEVRRRLRNLREIDVVDPFAARL